MTARKCLLITAGMISPNSPAGCIGIRGSEYLSCATRPWGGYLGLGNTTRTKLFVCTSELRYVSTFACMLSFFTEPYDDPMGLKYTIDQVPAYDVCRVPRAGGPGPMSEYGQVAVIIVSHHGVNRDLCSYRRDSRSSLKLLVLCRV